jgi:hypothetical protein
LVLGLAAALVRAGLALLGGQGAEQSYRIVRTVFGRSILLGLEFSVRVVDRTAQRERARRLVAARRHEHTRPQLTP